MSCSGLEDTATQNGSEGVEGIFLEHFWEKVFHFVQIELAEEEEGEKYSNSNRPCQLLINQLSYSSSTDGLQKRSRRSVKLDSQLIIKFIDRLVEMLQTVDTRALDLIVQ